MNPRALSSRGGSGKWWALGLTAAGAAGVTGLYVYGKNKVADRIQEALEAEPKGQPAPTKIPVRLTGYWPFAAREDEKKMEGGTEGAAAWRGKRVTDPLTGKRVQLHTLEQYRADPTRNPFVALSGDPDIWPFGQRLALDVFPGVVFRVVDTGSHFTGSKKVFRIFGREPLDICVDSKDSKVIPTAEATVIAGDNWQSGALVASAKAGHPIITAGDVAAAAENGAMERLLARLFGIG